MAALSSEKSLVQTTCAVSRAFSKVLSIVPVCVHTQAIAFFLGIKGLRGMIATQVIEEGDTIISLPRDLAINLGAESDFPGYAGAELARIRNDPIRR